MTRNEDLAIPEARRLLRLALAHPVEVARALAWMTAPDLDALLTAPTVLALSGLLTGAPLADVSRAVGDDAVGVALRWWAAMAPHAPMAPPTQEDVDALVVAIAGRGVEVATEAIDLMEMDIPEAMALRSAALGACLLRARNDDARR